MENENVFEQKKEENNLIASNAIEQKGQVIIPVIEEQLNVRKEIIETGKIHVSKTISKETEIVTVPFIKEEVKVERIEINQIVSEQPSVRYEDNVMIIPVVKEVVIVEKRLLLVEELRVTKNTVQDEFKQEIILSKENINIERIPSSQNE
ncbi:MAG: DUF2382 domain-containing protein [Chitinophagales bacterium]|nr:DUF2382 domain-containing protein [Chitinophagales bacterium]